MFAGGDQAKGVLTNCTCQVVLFRRVLIGCGRWVVGREISESGVVRCRDVATESGFFGCVGSEEGKGGYRTVPGE